VSVSDNLIDLVWSKDRPARPNEKVKVQPMEFAGKSFESKIEDLRKDLEKRKKSGIVICMDPSLWARLRVCSEANEYPIRISYA
jgi:Xaa-Pro aminopeptidase